MSTLDFADLDELATILEAAGVRDVSMDPSKLNLPGVWIELNGIDLDVLDGLTIKVNLVCLTGDTDPRRAATQLAALFNQVVPAIASLGGPAGVTTAGTWTFPGSTARLPGLAIPLDLTTTTEESP